MNKKPNTIILIIASRVNTKVIAASMYHVTRDKVEFGSFKGLSTERLIVETVILKIIKLSKFFH